MPFPLGHATVGVTLYELGGTGTGCCDRWKTLLWIAALANLPDLDILAGLLYCGNGNAFHRGPTHSLAFALIAAAASSRASKLIAFLPATSFKMAFALILSHLLADFFFTTSAVSFLWPLEVHWSAGCQGWGDIVNSIFFQAFEDVGIVSTCGIILALKGCAHRARRAVASAVSCLWTPW